MSLLVAGLAAGIGALGSAYNRANAKSERQASFKYMNDLLTSQSYQNILDSVENRGLFKLGEIQRDKDIDAIQNRMVAGGATQENALAARQYANESRDKLQIQLLQGDQARKDRINAQKLSLYGQNSQAAQNEYLQAAQDWSQWGAQTAGAAMQYGAANLLDPGAVAPPEGDALLGMAARVDNEGNPIMQPVLESYSEALGGGLKPMPKFGYDPLKPGQIGGLRGPGRDLSKSGLNAASNFPWTKD